MKNVGKNIEIIAICIFVVGIIAGIVAGNTFATYDTKYSTDFDAYQADGHYRYDEDALSKYREEKEFKILNVGMIFAVWLPTFILALLIFAGGRIIRHLEVLTAPILQKDKLEE